MTMGLDGTPSVSPSVVSGTYTGTTAAQTITLGFKPTWFICWNVTDSDDLNFFHINSLTTFMNVALAAGKITATWAAVDAGISLPSDADCNEDSKVYAYLAGR
jgi:hypothetical protein